MKYASIGGVPPSGWRMRDGTTLIGRSLTIVSSVGSQRNKPVLACSAGLRVAKNGPEISGATNSALSPIVSRPLAAVCIGGTRNRNTP